MIELQKICLYKGEKELLKNASAQVATGDRIALIGSNGAGKTSLLQAIYGEHNVERGNIYTHGEKIGYVTQDSPDCAVTELTQGIEQWQFDVAIAKLGLELVDMSRQLRTFSGGEATRIRIATAIANDPLPTVLLLDEPTNNIDASTKHWLAQFMKQYDGAIMFASHDRAFIDTVATKVWSIENQRLDIYSGNYSDYKMQKILNEQRIEKQFITQEAERKRLTVLLKKVKVSSQKTRVNAPKDNNKMAYDHKNDHVQKNSGKIATAIESRLERTPGIELTKKPKVYTTSLNNVGGAVKEYISLNNVSKQYGNNTILSNITLNVWSHDRVMITGKNGGGKTTLLDIIAGRANKTSGELALTPSVRMGYFSQDVYGLVADKSVYDNLISECESESDLFRQCRSLGLNAASVRQNIQELSRGQQAKIGFVKLLLGNYNVLILDEPTNHLDIEAREIIESAIGKYNGAIVFASHDEYFTRHIGAEKVVHLDSGK